MNQNRSKVFLIAGARPNFMKIAPLIRQFQVAEKSFEWSLVHTGQHYDHEMSAVFFKELGIPSPNYHLDAGGGTHAEQTSKIMLRFEEVCLQERPDLVIVVGDVNSTLACSIVAKKLGIKVAHIEAGLRSGDRSMPEEINRLVTDSISDLFFVTEESALENLRREGHSDDDIYFVGNVMIDNLFFQIERLRHLGEVEFETNKVKKLFNEYGVVTLHRPSNVDDKDRLFRIINSLAEISLRIPLLFAVHPRTALAMERFGLNTPASVVQLPPLPFMEFLNLWKDARLVITDSGGIQEETTALGIPCITLRENTERPVTVSEGSNILVGSDPVKFFKAVTEILDGEKIGQATRPKFWDGKASERILEYLRLRLS